MTHDNGTARRGSLHAHVVQWMGPYTCRLSIALLIALNFLRVSPAAGPQAVLMRPSAATCSRIGWRAALLGECERGSNKRNSDCEAKSFHGAHVVSPTTG